MKRIIMIMKFKFPIGIMFFAEMTNQQFFNSQFSSFKKEFLIILQFVYE